MSRFQSVISDSFEDNNNLTRVRIKVDPAKWRGASKDNESIKQLEEFTGYILQEYEDGTVDIYLPTGGEEPSIFNMQSTDIQSSGGDRYRDLKELIKQCLSKMGVNNIDIIEGIDKADCIHTLEDWMRQGGCNDGQIIDILKEFISETN
jgi:hypothetical protein